MGKAFNFTFHLFVFFSLFYSCFFNFLSCKFPFLNLFGSKFSELFFSLGVDTTSMLFVCMVLLVTSLVLLFSEVYMEHYNNKKFFFLTSSFLLSMLALSSGSSFLNVMIGWDGLGISSLFLIMFYSNKTTMFNSFLTFFFNRLGDILLIVIFCYVFSRGSLLPFFGSEMSASLFFLLVLCTLTKSAQFPLSSWLPAAMSAPTPISAMVHSSTLVTAGAFILMKTFSSLEYFNLTMIFGALSACTFLVGGFLANIEMDLKKIVAFSTMSQISMVILILSFSLFFFSLSHTFIHALFKTLLFCVCGSLFLVNFSDQTSKNLSNIKAPLELCSLLVFSAFSMSGLVFSSSFFTKDIVLEFLVSENFNFLFFLFLLGGMATILYSSSILDSFFTVTFSSPSGSPKKFLFNFIFFFSFCSLWCFLMVQEFLPLSLFPVISPLEMVLILILILIPMLCSNFFLKKNFSHLNYEGLYSKFFSFSIWKKLPILDKFSFQLSDQLFLKPTILNFSYIFFSKNFMGFSSILFVFLLTLAWV